MHARAAALRTAVLTATTPRALVLGGSGNSALGPRSSRAHFRPSLHFSNVLGPVGTFQYKRYCDVNTQEKSHHNVCAGHEDQCGTAF